MIISAANRVTELSLDAPKSKSIYHRELIVRFLCASFGKGGSFDFNTVTKPIDGDNDDVIATKACLKALHEAEAGSDVVLPCNESGSTLRFMISVACAYLAEKDLADKVNLVFETKGRLIERPLEELAEALAPHGITISKDMETRTVHVKGVMTPGEYFINGTVSSQYISGLLMALPVFSRQSVVHVTGGISSVHYIELTQDTMNKYGCLCVRESDDYIPEALGYKEVPTDDFKVEGDWSNGAFLLCLGALLRGGGLVVDGLNINSVQGDMAIIKFLDALNIKYRLSPNVIEVRGQAPKKMDRREEVTFDCSDIPDIAPYMAVLAAFFGSKTTLTGIHRLRIKESDRAAAVCEQLNACDIKTELDEDSLTIFGINDPLFDEAGEAIVRDSIFKLSSFHDHRMAMCAIMLCYGFKAVVDIDDTDCINKSFPELQEIIRREMMP